jgi:hypothetical protein
MHYPKSFKRRSDMIKIRIKLTGLASGFQGIVDRELKANLF